MTQFATRFERPVYAPGIALAIGVSTPQGLYIERRYLNKQGTVLAIRATAVQGPGLVCYREFGPLPDGTTQIAVCLTTENNATQADPVALVAAESPPLFNTRFTQPVLSGDKPLFLSLALSTTRQQLYFEREYLDANGETLGIHSELIYDRGDMGLFPVHPDLIPGTRWINACIRSDFRGTISASAEYTEQEHNAAEYN
jgi:hypothetical protein